MKQYNLGIIGAGMYGKVLMKYFKQDERANITWVNSASEATTKSAAEEFGVEKWSTDYRDVLNDPAEVIIDFKESRIADMSGIEALNKLTERYKKANKKLLLRHLSEDCRLLLKNADSVIEVNVLEDPTYKLPAED